MEKDKNNKHSSTIPSEWKRDSGSGRAVNQKPDGRYNDRRIRSEIPPVKTKPKTIK